MTLPAIPFILSLLPILSSISGFLSFYWRTIAADDLGSGTILSACWIVPIAFIPRTLKLEEWGEDKDGKPLPVDSGKDSTPATPSVPTVAIHSTSSSKQVNVVQTITSVSKTPNVAFSSRLSVVDQPEKEVDPTKKGIQGHMIKFLDILKRKK